MLKLWTGFLVCVALCAGVLAAGASAASTATIGQTGAPLGNYFWSSVDFAFDSYVVPPGGGWVVSLNTQAASSTICAFIGGAARYNLQVLRPLGGGQYKVLGDTGNKTDPCDGQLYSYPVQIQVQAGDVLGVYLTSGTWAGVTSKTGASETFDYVSEPAVGATVTLAKHLHNVFDVSATLVQTPQSKRDCKKGGWQTLVDGNGNSFENQGDCVSFVASKGKNQPANS